MDRNPKRGHLGNPTLRAFLLCCLVAAPALLGHDGPEHRIDDLSYRIQYEPERSDLLIERAFEFNALGAWASAEKDFHRALQLGGPSEAALHGLAQALFEQGKVDEAGIVATQAIELVSDIQQQAPFYAQRALCREQQSDWGHALLDWRAALRAENPEVDWFLGEARCLKSLDRIEEATTALADAIKRNPSAALRRQWIAALVDSGQNEEAMRQIDRELENVRWRSHWLILRARVYQNLGDAAGRRRDAEAARAEIASRLDPSRPDPYLQEQAAAALALAQP